MTRLHRDQGGQVSALAVVAAGIFACLLILVINTGAATSGKIEMQNAADAAAVSGATWVARGLNIISLNNVTESQLLALALIIPALDRAAPLAEATLQLELLACPALVFPVAIIACKIAIQVQLYILKGYTRPAIEIMQPLAERNSFLWTTMRLLGQMNGLVSRTFPLMAQSETYRIAVTNGADLGVLIPAQYSSGGSLLPTLPVRPGKMRPDLCVPTREGSPSPSSRGYNPLLGYPVGQGPLDYYAAKFRWPLLFPLLFTSFIDKYFDAFRSAQYQQVCGGGIGDTSFRKPVPSREACVAAGGGTATWNLVQYDTVPLPARQPNIDIRDEDDDRLAGVPGVLRMERDCGWIPPATPDGGGRYKRVEESLYLVGRQENGDPIYEYSYRVYHYSFVAAMVETDANREITADLPSAGDEPIPYFLGTSAGMSRERIEDQLRYLAVAYRTRGTEVAPSTSCRRSRRIA